MNIFDKLKIDHNKIRRLLINLETKPRKKNYFIQLEQEMLLHSYAENKAFYEPIKNKDAKLYIIAVTCEKEHHLIAGIIKYVKIANFEKQECLDLIPILKKTIEAHILKEEENVFQIVQNEFNDNCLKKMSERLDIEKKNYNNTLMKKSIPK